LPAELQVLINVFELLGSAIVGISASAKTTVVIDRVILIVSSTLQSRPMKHGGGSRARQ
jgi:hypothetical protein